ncbi:AraC family transcriptional regulator [Shimwellia pseudoproteus]|uniref:AraC family transcriptional regulator n=1 Tax=Shimwellia pseudoproteus TaxID=570012 RepID=UPI0018EADFB5|nr:AraC family transcriptional regulator [Shimwellia pseudoproteus]MBJ3816489.1 AraC family transcriptional regulator [Shimwellia pseudoproteus]
MKTCYPQLKAQLLTLLPCTLKTATAIDGLGLIRRDLPVTDESCIYRPMIEFIIQGERKSTVGSDTLAYGAGEFMVAGIDTPCIISDIRVAPDTPFLGINLGLDLALITQLMLEMETGSIRNESHKGLCITPATPALADAFLRLLRLLESPRHIPILAPMIIREIHYYLLTGPLGEYLQAIATEGSHSQRIAQSVSWLRAHFLDPLDINGLADSAHMSLSTFHRHFRKVTSYSPLQYQKRLRLYEAQRLMLVEHLDATSTAFQVGYESISQFNREYKREFGNPPQRDVDRMRFSGIELD